MKTYFFTISYYETNPGCDCCPNDVFELYNCPDIEHTYYNEVGCYEAVLEDVTGHDWFEECLDWEEEQYIEKLKELGVEVMFVEE